MTTNTNDALPDAVRVPLDSLHADAAYLIGRLQRGTMTASRVVEVIRERIDAAKAALTTAAGAVKESLTAAHALPPGIVRDDTVHGEMYYTAAQVRAMLAQAAPAPADSVTAAAVGVVAMPSDDIDAVGLARYKVVPAHESMFHRFAVVAGDGKQQLYLGREIECENMARKFAGAFLDGAFYQANIAPTPPAQTADSVLEDAARLTYEQAHAIRQGHEISASDGYFEARPQIDSSDRRKVFQAGFERGWDAARKQGGA